MLFLVVDDLNDWVGCLGGHPNAITPNIDRLAGEGTLFTRAYATSPLCKPSRTSAITGLYPTTTAVYQNRGSWREAVAGHPPVSEYFHANGYETLSAGKVVHAPWGRRAAWLSRLPWALARPFMEERFGRWDDFLSWQDSPAPDTVPASGMPGADAWFDWAGLDVDDEHMGDMKVATWTAAQLGRRHDRPFFLACGIYRPHLPWYVPRKYYDQHPLDGTSLPAIRPDDLVDVPATARAWAGRLGRDALVEQAGRARAAVRGYLASTTFADACVGRVLDALRGGPNASNTIVVLWSDHGFHLGEKQMWDKRVLWEEATRVPLIVSGPGEHPGRCGRTVSLADLYPTLVERCGLPTPPALDGESLVSLLADPAGPWERPALSTFLEGNHALRSERWRYIRYADGSEELYDHEVDPHEWVNVADRPGSDAAIAELSGWLARLVGTRAHGAPA